MRIEPWKKRHKDLKIRYLTLQARYYRLKAKMMSGEPIKQESQLVTKKRYYEVLAKLKRCQISNSRLRQKRENSY